MSRQVTRQETIRLVPSTYAVSSESYLSVSDASNAYTNTDSTTYATITNTNASTSSRYYYLRGFNFNDIPSGATINSFTVKIKGYESGLATGTSYAPRLANGTSALSNTTATSNFGTSTSTITIPTGALTWQQIINYGSNFTIMVYVRRNNRNTTGYFYCYGAEIEVTYSISGTEYEVSFSNTSSSATSDPSTTQYVFQGGNQEITITTPDINNISVTDNNVDVTSSLIQHTISGSSDTLTFVPSGYTNETNTTNSTNYQYTNAYKAATTSGNSYARWEVESNASFSIYYTFNITGIPSNAIITVVQVEAALRYDARSVSGSFTEDVQLYNGTTPMGEPLHFVTDGNSNIAMTLQTISNTGSWTPQALQNLRFVMSGSNGTTTSARRIYLNGVTLTISYELPSGYYYTYTISNISADHSIVIADKSSESLYLKVNGQFIKCNKIYKKINNVWTEVNLNTLTDPGIYIKK